MLPDDPALRDLSDKVDDLARALSRQAVTLDRIATGAGARAETAEDVPLLVELHALHLDALGCAATARSRRERTAFDALAAGLERLIAGRGGTVVRAQPGEAFDGARMEVAEVVRAEDPALDRTVAELVGPGLAAGPRTVRPARVRVHRAR